MADKIPPPGPPRQAQRVCVLNNSAVSLSFKVNYKDASGKDGHSSESGQLLMGQRDTIDLAKAAGIEPGVKMKPHVAVMLAGAKDGPEIEFQPNELTATYSVDGSALSWSVELL